VFSDELVRLGAVRGDIVAITAAMLRSTGLDAFASAYPQRCYDVGIAEQHALTSAAGMAMAGLHPVVAIYATFLNRAFDQLLMDVALHRVPVTVVLDRAGVTGPDGPSHHGMWDLSLLGMMPGLRVAAPRDEATLREELGEAVAVTDGPTVLRFSKGNVVTPIPALYRVGPVDVLREADKRNDVLLVGVGAFAELAMATADQLGDQGIGVTVVDPRWIFPVPDVLTELAMAHELVVTMEDSGRHGGFGSALAGVLRDHSVSSPLLDFALPQRFLGHGTRSQLLTQVGLTARACALRITEKVAALLGESEPAGTEKR
jgi:1-deoxy-D-xylulose-5-phosphate synthase